MNYYNQGEKATVGSYNPSENWSNHTHFAVMGERSQELIASVGYFQNIETQKEWCFEDYLHAAECIEQAQLYANAPRLLELAKLACDPRDNAARIDLANLINKILDISEPATRLLGEHAMQIIRKAKSPAIPPLTKVH